MPNLVITIEGGAMNDVMTDDDPATPVRIILQDFDSIKEGDDPNGEEIKLEANIAQVTEVFRTHDAPTPEPETGPFNPPTNNSVLEGLRCPQCGSEGPFSIACITVGLFADDGVDEYGDMEWESTSGMSCQGYDTDCDFTGTVADFTIGEQREGALS